MNTANDDNIGNLISSHQEKPIPPVVFISSTLREGERFVYSVIDKGKKDEKGEFFCLGKFDVLNGPNSAESCYRENRADGNDLVIRRDYVNLSE